MFGNFSSSLQMDEEIKEEAARSKLHEVSEAYNMDIEDVEVEFDSTLPYNVLGRTSTSRYSDGEVQITVGDRFLEASEPEQLHTMAHEGFHVKQFRGEETEWLRNELGVSSKFASEVERAWRGGHESDIEGITEVVVNNLLPFQTRTSYPYETRRKQRELESRGIDLESELLDNIEDEMNGLVENYKQVYESFEQGDIYVESGKIGDIDYTAVSTEQDPSESVNDYLNDLMEEVEDVDDGTGYSRFAYLA